MANAGMLGLGLLAYASWQTMHFLHDRGSRVWARQKYHHYLPRPTTESAKRNIACGNCRCYSEHPDFSRSGICTNSEWQITMRSEEIMVKRNGHCELFQRGLSS